MSILGSIVSAIFHHAGVTTSAQAAPASPSSASPSSASPSSASPSSASPSSASPSPGMPPKPGSPVDVNAVLTRLAAANKEHLDWKTSIVDLMKLLNLDSSLSARKELAKELHYTGDTNNSAAMNVWLHAQVMRKVADNGGKVPADLMHK